MQNRRLTDADLQWVNAAFAGEDNEAFATLRKLFYYEISPTDPLGHARDMWSTLDLKDMDNESRLVAVAARQMLVNHIEGALLVIKQIAGDKKETPDQILKRLQKNSSK